MRKVPVHSELVRLGFLDYVTAMKDRNEDLLWPMLATREGKPGGYFSHWFGAYRRSLGFGTYPDFHCLRHTVRSQLAETEVSEQVIDAIVGHEVKGSMGAKVYTHRSLTGLKRAIEILRYGLTPSDHARPSQGDRPGDHCQCGHQPWWLPCVESFAPFMGCSGLGAGVHWTVYP